MIESVHIKKILILHLPMLSRVKKDECMRRAKEREGKKRRLVKWNFMKVALQTSFISGNHFIQVRVTDTHVHTHSDLRAIDYPTDRPACFCEVRGNQKKPMWTPGEDEKPCVDSNSSSGLNWEPRNFTKMNISPHICMLSRHFVLYLVVKFTDFPALICFYFVCISTRSKFIA